MRLAWAVSSAEQVDDAARASKQAHPDAWPVIATLRDHVHAKLAAGAASVVVTLTIAVPPPAEQAPLVTADVVADDDDEAPAEVTPRRGFLRRAS